MYVPPHAREERADVLAHAINEIGFGIVGFELIVDELIGALKLSRNRTDADRVGVAALMERSENPSVAELAATVCDRAERSKD